MTTQLRDGAETYAASLEEAISQLKTQRGPAWERPVPERDEREADAKLFRDHAATVLSRQLDLWSPGRVYAPSAGAAVGGTVGHGAELMVERHLTSRLINFFNTPMETRSITVSQGTWLVGPPYDTEWAAGSGLAFGATVDGSLFTISGDGFSAAAVGFYVSSPDVLTVALTPQGDYDFSWFSVNAAPALRSRGGMAITIYFNGNPTPIEDRRAVLWNVSGVGPWSGQHGTGRIADAASPAWGFGPVPIAPVYVSTAPGRRFLVWVWCWQINQLIPPTGSGFLAMMRCKMPAVAVNAGPPIIIP